MKRFLTLCSLAISTFMVSNTASAQDCDCMVPLDESFVLVPFDGAAEEDGYRNDDFSSLSQALPFTFNLYGVDYTSCYINNNGNVSFDAPYYEYTASGFPIAAYPMVAAFWADVDTRNELSGLVYYKVTDHALIIRWKNVGYYAMWADKLNDFQLIISDGQSELIPDGHNISFCYADMQWTTGDASGGFEGFDGSPANIGANAGDGISAMQLGLFNTSGDIFDGPLNNNDGVDYLDFTNIYFSTNPLDENQSPVGVSNYCDTIIGYPGDTLAFFFYDTEGDQELEFVLDTDWEEYLSLGETSGMIVEGGEIQRIITDESRDLGSHSAMVAISDQTPEGVYNFTITATDNGTPALSDSRDYVLLVGQGSPTTIMEMAHNSSVNGYFQDGRLMFTGVDQSKVTSVKLYDAQGRCVYSHNRMLDINTEQLNNGMYMFVIKTNEGTVNGKVMKQ